VPLVRSSISHSRTARDKSQRGRLQSDFTDWACCNAPSSAASRQCLHRAFIGTAHVRGGALTLRSQCGAGCSDGSVYCVHACLRALCVDAVPLVRSSINHSRTARDKSQRGRLQSDFTDWACCNAPSSAASRQCLHRAFIGTAHVRGGALTLRSQCERAAATGLCTVYTPVCVHCALMPCLW